MPGQLDSFAGHDMFLQLKFAREDKKAASLKSSTSTESIKTTTKSVGAVSTTSSTKSTASTSSLFLTGAPAFESMKHL
ncbi:hypothetical protein BCR33DRAFT_720867 [Rhizoclosmatium globosum]|uniref:Uncharacterized protein n=1 Tax=Rhizoclosmatium globosum TaxID=329046 RepID=A0A1Y2BTT2_9FUNG|nr:hypothetical protein BCR33DRAFT_720867 [Rhizoclosmatium globosum]|eukprot:ORY38156.1 hypothetical protein BCR33DRAFT_720867 [Rhizoclosmatium globosum]